MESIEFIGMASLIVQALIIFVLLATNRLLAQRNKDSASIGVLKSEPEVRVIEKQVFVPMPTSKPPIPDARLLKDVQPSAIEIIEKQNDELLEEMRIKNNSPMEKLNPFVEKKEKKVKEITEYSKCFDCDRVLDGGGILREGRTFCLRTLCFTCAKKRRDKRK